MVDIRNVCQQIASSNVQACVNSSDAQNILAAVTSRPQENCGGKAACTDADVIPYFTGAKQSAKVDLFGNAREISLAKFQQKLSGMIQGMGSGAPAPAPAPAPVAPVPAPTPVVPAPVPAPAPVVPPPAPAPGTVPPAASSLTQVQALVGQDRFDDAMNLLHRSTIDLLNTGHHGEAQQLLNYFNSKADEFSKKKVEKFGKDLKALNIAQNSPSAAAVNQAISASESRTGGGKSANWDILVLGFRFTYNTPRSLKEEGLGVGISDPRNLPKLTPLHGVQPLEVHIGAEFLDYFEAGLELGYKFYAGHLEYGESFGKVDEWSFLHTIPMKAFFVGKYDWANGVGIGGIFTFGTEWVVSADNLMVSTNVFGSGNGGKYNPDPATNVVVGFGPQFRYKCFRFEAMLDYMWWRNRVTISGDMFQIIKNADTGLAFSGRIGCEW